MFLSLLNHLRFAVCQIFQRLIFTTMLKDMGSSLLAFIAMLLQRQALIRYSILLKTLQSSGLYMRVFHRLKCHIQVPVEFEKVKMIKIPEADSAKLTVKRISVADLCIQLGWNYNHKLDPNYKPVEE